jgi:uncharacterized BrkB/YihY/UPF0761 family membrane protein
MKVSGKGIVIIIVFLIGIPVLADFILSAALSKNSPDSFGMSKSLFSGYGRSLPFYIIYLVVAFTVIYLIKKYREYSNKKK